jgi:hypothetical protein
MAKRLSFVRMAAGVPVEEFGDRWRRHAEDALRSMPPSLAPHRLAHCVVRPGRPGRLRPPYDGVAISWYDDASVIGEQDAWLTTHAAAADGQAGVLDYASTSNVVVEERTVLGEAWLLDRWQERGPAPTLLLIALLEAAPGHTRESFRDYWWDQHRPLANSLIPAGLQPAAYIHDYILPGEPGSWAGIGELYENSLDLARQRHAWTESDAARPVVDDEERLLVRATRRVLVTDQELVWPLR